MAEERVTIKPKGSGELKRIMGGVALGGAFGLGGAGLAKAFGSELSAKRIAELTGASALVGGALRSMVRPAKPESDKMVVKLSAEQRDALCSLVARRLAEMADVD